MDDHASHRYELEIPMTRFLRSRSTRPQLTMLVVLSALLLPGVVRPTLARAANLVVRNDGAVLPISPTGDSQSPAHRPSREAARLGAPEYVGTQSYPPVGGYSTESVIGTDDRSQVTATSTFPSSAIVHLVIDFPLGTFTCTGWMIAADRVATAGHCIYDPNEGGGFADSITVIPGRNGGTAPFGSFVATNWYVPHKWKHTQTPKFDYGVIKLGSNVGDTVGWFGFAAEDDTFLDKRKIKVRGYPGEKPFGTMWTMNGKIKELQPARVFYGLDTSGGQSGSPIFGKKPGCDPCGFGIHAYGTPSPPATQRNSGTRINSTVFDFLQQTGAN
jgi:glutamyl endopeptidase